MTITIFTNIRCILFQRLGQPIQDRHREQEDRPRAFEELGKKLQLYMKFVDAYKQKVKKKNWGDTLYCHKKKENNEGNSRLYESAAFTLTGIFAEHSVAS